MNLANRKLAFIQEHLAAGRTVYIQTALRTWKLSKKHADMVKVSGESLYLQNGKRWDCADYCKISAQ
jgi:hypothetical protein